MSHHKFHRKVFLSSALAVGLGALGLAKPSRVAKTASAQAPDTCCSAPREQVRRDPRSIPHGGA